jgi:alkanesulfonate monooxygenase SsuD/methylene tetrahydromethanopterin reductase-like flavin-dependent oxidoreductase (luciferase family)
MLDKLIAVYKKAISTCEPVGAFVNDRTAAATVCVCAPTREEAKVIAKDAIDFTTRKAAELFTPFAKQEVKGYEYYKKMAEQAVAIGDYRLSLADLDKRIEAGAVMVGDPEDCLKVAKIYESAGVDLILMLVQVGAIPHEKVMQTIDLVGKHVMPKLSASSKAYQEESAAAAGAR